MANKAGKLRAIKISGTKAALTAEATTTSDNQTYQITDADKRVLDYSETVVVNDDGVPTVESYALNKLNGTVTFATVDAGRGTITIDGYYLPMTTVAYAYEDSFNIACDILDAAKYGDTYKDRVAGLKGAEGSLSQWDITDTTFNDDLVAGLPIVIETRDETGDSVIDRMWVLLNSVEMAAAIGSPQNMTVGWTSTDEMLRW